MSLEDCLICDLDDILGSKISFFLKDSIGQKGKNVISERILNQLTSFLPFSKALLTALKGFVIRFSYCRLKNDEIGPKSRLFICFFRFFDVIAISTRRVTLDDWILLEKYTERLT